MSDGTKNRSAIACTQERLGDYVENIANAVADSEGFLTCALEFDGPNNELRVKALTASGWTLIEKQTIKEPMSQYVNLFNSAKGQYDVGFYLYLYYDVIDADVKDVRFYKGVNLTADQLKVTEVKVAAATTKAAATAAAKTATATAAKTADVSVVIAATLVSAAAAVVLLKKKH